MATIGELRELHRSLRRTVELLVKADRSELAGTLAVEADELASTDFVINVPCILCGPQPLTVRVTDEAVPSQQLCGDCNVLTTIEVLRADFEEAQA